MTKRSTAFALLLLVSVIWGAASPIVKHTLTWFDPQLFLTYRFFISTLISIPFLLLGTIRFPKKASDTILILATGFVSAPLSLFLFFEALSKTSALSGSLITAAGPLFMILGGMLFFHDRISGKERLGISVVIAGTLFTVIGPFLFNGHADVLGSLEGNALMLLAVISDIGGALLTKEAMKKGISPSLIAHSQFITGFSVFLPFLLFRSSPAVILNTLKIAPAEAHMGVLFMAVISGTVAYTLRNIAVKSIEVSESALYAYLQPLWAAILAIFWLGETVTLSYVIGGIIIAIGVIVADGHALGHIRARNPERPHYRVTRFQKDASGHRRRRSA